MTIEEILIQQVFEYGLESKLLELIVPRMFHYEHDTRVRDMDSYSRNLAHMARHHLAFVVKFGHHNEKKVIRFEGKGTEANYPDEFDAWVFAGCPGLSLIKLEQAIHDFSAAVGTKQK